MKHHAKASSAGSTQRQGKSLGRFFRGAFATRGSSSDAKGSSAPSSRTKLSVLALAISLLGVLIFLVASAFAAKEAYFYFGNQSGSGSLGGEFSSPRDSAVNSTGAGGVAAGTVYVADDENNRIQRFTSSGEFVSAWGADVIQAGKPGDQAGTNPFEVCTTSADCQAGAAAGGNGETSGDGALDHPQSVAVDGDTGNVYVSDRFNRRVNEYSATGAFIRSFGFDVDATEAPIGYEVCPAANVCKAGEAGAGTGQVGATFSGSGTLGIAVSPPDGNGSTGTVFLADTANQRVNTYNLDGTSPSSFGSATQFGEDQPRKITVDSRGIVYASNSKNGGQIVRYDSTNANGGGIGFLAPIVAPLPGVDETQKVGFTGFVQGDKFTLTCPNGETTDPIEWTSSAIFEPEVQIALNAKCGLSFGVAESYPYISVTFHGIFAATNVPQMTCTRVTGSGTCEVITATNGAPPVPGPLLGATGDPSVSSTSQFATSGLAVDPDSDGGGSDEDVLYVLRDPSIGSTRVQQFGPLNDPGLTAPPTATDDAHGAGASFGEVRGLGLNDATGTLYVSATNDVGSGGSGHRVYVLQDTGSIPAPTASMTEVSGVSESTSTLSGAVDPQGGNVSCKFQYATDPEFTDATDVSAPGCGLLSNGGGAQAVSQEVTGLIPNTTYFVRLAVSRAFIPASTVFSSNLKVFTTKTTPPVVSEVGAVGVEVTSARLVGTIDPRHSDTGYVFEYGTTPALGSSTPPFNVGNGSTPLVASQVVTGLTKDTTYYFRLTATNAFGSTSSTQATLHTRTQSAPLPDGRAYEQVSPADKNFGDAVPGAASRAIVAHAVGADGQGIAYASNNAFGNPPGQIVNQEQTQYTSLRDADGWHTRRTVPNVCPEDLSKPQPVFWWLEITPRISSNADKAFVQVRENAGCATPPLDPAAPLPALNVYRASYTPNSAAYDLLAPEFPFEPGPFEPHGTASLTGEYGASSDDFSHIFYTSTGQQTPDAPVGETGKLYEWDNGTVRLASVDPAGNPFTTFSHVASLIETDATNAVSANGERVFFYANTPTFFMREAGTATYDIGESECTESCGSTSFKIFEWADVGGDAVAFSSEEKLTDSDTQPDRDLYLYRHSPNPTVEQNLTLVTGDKEPADGSSPGVPERNPVLGMSDDGNTVFFRASGQLVPGKTTQPGQKIYRWSWNNGSPTLQYLASATYEEQALFKGTEGQHWERRVSKDGKAFLLETLTRVDPVADHDDDFDVYLWREGKGWSCVSCQQPEAPSGGPSTTGRTGVSTGNISPAEKPIATELQTAMSAEDGERVFFVTEDALVPADVNGPCTLNSELGFYPCADVYEWHDGGVSLVTPGTASSDLNLIGASDSANDVFFYTHQKLVGWDADDNIDVYDARAGGGLPEPPAQPAACEGESCRGAGTSAPGGSGAGTAAFQGPGNPKPSAPQACPKGKRKVRRGGKTRCVKSGQRKHRRQHSRTADNNRRASR